MVRNKKLIILVLIVFSIVLSIFLTNKYINKNKADTTVAQQSNEISTAQNKSKPIEEYSEEFIDNYYEGTNEILESDNLDNILIVGSDNKIADTYGASKIIDAPNNQYFLQYNSVEEKNHALEKFKQNDEINYVEKNITYKIESFNSWGITKMGLNNASEFASTLIGNNLPDVTVAIIDTGCDMTTFNNNYSGKIIESYNALNSSTNLSDMSDTHGHGTHIAGTIAEGTPSNVKIYPVKASNSGEISNLYIIFAINYIVLNNKANVINMSFGAYEYDASLYASIEFATKNNIICVAAAGNDNKADPSYPAALDNTISIAACDSNLNRASFSNYNPTVTFTAPGVSIKSINGTSSGTSMATPHAAAAIAILKSFNIDYTLEDVICILRKYAIDLGTSGKDDYYGYGFINLKTISYCTCNCHDCDKLYCFNCDCDNCIFNHAVNTIKKIEVDSPFLIENKLLEYNYGSLTNLSNIQLKIYYNDENYIKKYLLELDNCEILGYDPYCYTEQTITIKYGGKQTTFTLDQDEIDYGWEYTAIDSGHIKLTTYKPTTYHKGKDLEKMYIPESIDGLTVTALGSSLFADTTLKNIILPDSLKEIGDNAFLNCTNLENIILPENLVEIKAMAFKNCTKLTNINIPQNVSNIGNYIFYGCINIDTLTVDSNNINYDSRNNCNALIKTSNNTLLFGTHTTAIPLSIETIGRYAFIGNTKLTSIVIPNSVTKILDHAFFNCTNIEEIIGLKNITSIGSNAFSNISNLTLAIFNDTYAKTYAESENIDFVYLSLSIPVDSTYIAFDTVKTNNLTISLLKNNSTIETINSGITVTYPNNNTSFRYGDTCFNIIFTSQLLGSFEETLAVTVNNPPKTSITPNITVSQKTYDGTLVLDKSSITISNLQATEYTIESATTVSANVRKYNCKH